MQNKLLWSSWVVLAMVYCLYVTTHPRSPVSSEALAIPYASDALSFVSLNADTTTWLSLKKNSAIVFVRESCQACREAMPSIVGGFKQLQPQRSVVIVLDGLEAARQVQTRTNLAPDAVLIPIPSDTAGPILVVPQVPTIAWFRDGRRAAVRVGQPGPTWYAQQRLKEFFRFRTES